MVGCSAGLAQKSAFHTAPLHAIPESPAELWHSPPLNMRPNPDSGARRMQDAVGLSTRSLGMWRTQSQIFGIQQAGMP
jgi:hypothetical protein